MQKGAARIRDKSRTLIPLSGPAFSAGWTVVEYGKLPIGHCKARGVKLGTKCEARSRSRASADGLGISTEQLNSPFVIKLNAGLYSSSGSAIFPRQQNFSHHYKHSLYRYSDFSGGMPRLGLPVSFRGMAFRLTSGRDSQAEDVQGLG